MPWILSIRFADKKLKEVDTAGNAKKEIANTEKQDATIFPVQVRGTASPYPMVVTVILPIRISQVIKLKQIHTTPHHKASA